MSGIGHAMQHAIKTMIQIQGQTIIVHQNINTPEATSFEVRGLKNTASKHSTQVVFQFTEALDIPIGAVLQVKGSRDYWKVTDTEDIVHDDTFVNFEVRVQKVNIAGQPTRPAWKPGDTYNLQGTHARVNIHSQDNSVNVSHQTTENVFADMRQIIQNQISDDNERDQILKRLNELEASKGTTGFIEKYRAFIASAANHVTLIAPFIPLLTQMLPS
jgi:hypothetical protein